MFTLIIVQDFHIHSDYNDLYSHMKQLTMMVTLTIHVATYKSVIINDSTTSLPSNISSSETFHGVLVTETPLNFAPSHPYPIFLINRLGKAQDRCPAAQLQITQLIIDTSVFYSATRRQSGIVVANIMPIVPETAYFLTFIRPGEGFVQ